IEAGADGALLGALLQRRDLLLGVLRDARLADQLVDRRHVLLVVSRSFLSVARLQCFRSEPPAVGEDGIVPTRKTEERLPLPVRWRPPVSQRTTPRERGGHALLI